MVLVSGYLIGSTAGRTGTPLHRHGAILVVPVLLTTERGRAGYDTYRNDWPQVIWHTASPE